MEIESTGEIVKTRTRQIMDEDYWIRFRHETAARVTAHIFATEYGWRSKDSDIANWAVKLTDALIARLKGEQR